MLFVLVQVDDEIYCINARDVVEVVPLVRWRKLPHAPPGVLGVINHHGKLVPTVDLTEFTAGRSSNRHLSTKIIVVDYFNDSGESFHLGIVTEKVLETFVIDERDFVDSGVATPGARYLGSVATTDKGLVQRLNLRDVFTRDVRERLFSALKDYESDDH